MTIALHNELQELTLGKVECAELEPLPDGSPRKKDLFASADKARRFYEIVATQHKLPRQEAYGCTACNGFHLYTVKKNRHLQIPSCPPLRAWRGKRRSPKRRSRCRRRRDR